MKSSTGVQSLRVYHVYVLRSEVTGRRYTGSCEDLEDRFRRHNAGESKSTRHGIPWTMVYNETFETRAEAMRRERYFKTGAGRRELDEHSSGPPTAVGHC